MLGMCRSVDGEFTLAEIVSRVLDERPEMILEFAETWGDLLQARVIRIRKRGRPNTYELVAGQSKTGEVQATPRTDWR
jgi:hypothetical protein